VKAGLFLGPAGTLSTSVAGGQGGLILGVLPGNATAFEDPGGNWRFVIDRQAGIT